VPSPATRSLARTSLHIANHVSIGSLGRSPSPPCDAVLVRGGRPNSCRRGRRFVPGGPGLPRAASARRFPRGDLLPPIVTVSYLLCHEALLLTCGRTASTGCERNARSRKGTAGGGIGRRRGLGLRAGSTSSRRCGCRLPSTFRTGLVADLTSGRPSCRSPGPAVAGGETSPSGIILGRIYRGEIPPSRSPFSTRRTTRRSCRGRTFHRIPWPLTIRGRPVRGFLLTSWIDLGRGAAGAAGGQDADGGMIHEQGAQGGDGQQARPTTPGLTEDGPPEAAADARRPG